MPELQAPASPGAIDIIRGLKELEYLTGNETFTWKGENVVCFARTFTGTNEWEDASLNDQSSVRIYVRKEYFLTVDSTLITVDSDLWTADSDMPHPVAGRSLTFRGRVWRITAAREAGTRSHYELDLRDSNK